MFNKKKLTLSIFLLLSLMVGQTVFAQTITDTESVTISATVGGIIVTPPSGGLTGGGYVEPIEIPKTAVRFSGFAYPFATISISKQGKEILKVDADSNGAFSATLPEKYDSTVLYSVQATDVDGNKSLLLNYPIVIEEGYLTHLSGILFAPTILADKLEVALNDFITFFGSALPNKDIDLDLTGASGKTFNLTSPNNGKYSITTPLSGLTRGEYTASVHYLNDSRYSKLVRFTVGDKNILMQKELDKLPGDCNKDNIINLIDFSVLAFWYKKPNPPVCVDTNQDEIINLVDFSVLAFYWTG